MLCARIVASYWSPTILAWFPALFAILIAILVVGSPATAEIADLRIARCSSTGCLPIMLVEHERLIEKHAKLMGLGDVTVDWRLVNDGSFINAGIIAGEIHVAATGTGAFVTLWGRTKGHLEAKGISALSAASLSLVTRNPAVTSIRDLGDGDRIALPAAVISIHATTLQRAAVETFGDRAWAKLDRLTVSMAPPQGYTALTSGTEITSYMSHPPWTERALRHPGIRRILSSDDVWGGRLTTFVVYATSRFRDDNPKLYVAIRAALADGFAMLAGDPRRAAEVYLRMSGDRATVDDILKDLASPDQTFSEVPQRMFAFAEFKRRIGVLKEAPASWKDMFFPELHDRPGN